MIENDQTQENEHPKQNRKAYRLSRTFNKNTIRRAGMKRDSLSVLYSMIAEKDELVNDELSKTQKSLRELREEISIESKKKYLLETDVNYMIKKMSEHQQKKLSNDEIKELSMRLWDRGNEKKFEISETQLATYGNLFFELQTKPKHIARLIESTKLSDVNLLLDTVVFTIFGKQYEQREEMLLLLVIKEVLFSDIEESTESSNLMRGNTTISRLMTTYTRRELGQEYLKNVLSDKIQYILENTDEGDNELNPVRIYQSLIQSGEIKQDPSCDENSINYLDSINNNPVVSKTIAERTQKICNLAKQILDAITESVERVPFGIRWICKQIWNLSRKKFPDLTDENLCSLVGGFFFLRFINPAIVSPHQYIQVKKNLPATQKKLTNIAKLLQMLANKPIYSKEPQMLIMNSFINANIAPTNTFLSQLCNVDDFYDSLDLNNCLFLASQPYSLSISAKELVNIHSLFATSVQNHPEKYSSLFKKLLADLGNPPQKPGPDKQDHSFEIMLQQSPTPSSYDDDIFEPIEKPQQLSYFSVTCIEVKSILVQIIRAMPSLHSKILEDNNKRTNRHKTRVLNLESIAKSAATSKDLLLVKWGLKASDMLTELENSCNSNDVETVSSLSSPESDPKPPTKADSPSWYINLVNQIVNELVHLSKLLENLKQEQNNLKNIHQTLINHNKYLESQLVSYQSHFGNSIAKTEKQLGFIFSRKKKPSPVMMPAPIVGMHPQKFKSPLIKSSMSSSQTSVYSPHILPKITKNETININDIPPLNHRTNEIKGLESFDSITLTEKKPPATSNSFFKKPFRSNVSAFPANSFESNFGTFSKDDFGSALTDIAPSKSLFGSSKSLFSPLFATITKSSVRNVSVADVGSEKSFSVQRNAIIET
ncbi:hypothetical protein BB559_002104 [Furculomyces boomerangus]|uniref:Ras-GAP domain-containing protein n=1 Tax=Furculomyces boomerangus TaxID=61424 RepID=A0A2T9YY18_9FUNG|nr:hypothetical protein BB559_002104 [Furculomyces boomerangus]